MDVSAVLPIETVLTFFDMSWLASYLHSNLILNSHRNPLNSMGGGKFATSRSVGNARLEHRFLWRLGEKISVSLVT